MDSFPRSLNKKKKIKKKINKYNDLRKKWKKFRSGYAQCNFGFGNFSPSSSLGQNAEIQLKKVV